MKVDRVAEFKCLAERSRFFAVLFPAAGEDEVLKMVRLKKGEHRKANHHCWAWRGRARKRRAPEKSRDDGEVGHPGRVLLELLRTTASRAGCWSPACSAASSSAWAACRGLSAKPAEGAIAEFKKIQSKKPKGKSKSKKKVPDTNVSKTRPDQVIMSFVCH